MKCKECCGDGYNLRIIKKGNGYTTERVTCEHCNGTGEVQMTELKLKPCPFCGSEASQITQVIDGWVKYDEPRTYYVVGCKNCGVGFRKHFMWEAIESWNKRVVAE